jgi:N-sulfoglucosamine sulfohydrolase
MKAIICLLVALLAAVSVVEAQPNVLIILADDCTHSDLPLYGGENAKTPNIDRLAEQGLTFNRAYLSEAMCQPCRSALYSGLYPMGNGSAWNHSGSRPEITTIPQHLGSLGYRTGLSGKVHVVPQKCYPFEKIEGFDPNCVRNPTMPHTTEFISEFMARDKTPFCLVVALVEPHVPWVMGDPSKYPTKKIKLPPYMVDTPLTRESFGKYLAEITYMDGQVGKILQALEKTGKAGNTLVLFSSEQGAQMPGCKWTNWDSGMHTALVARWPGKITAGNRTAALVQYVDVAPTLIELAGGNPAEFHYDGASFTATLFDPAKPHRKYVYGMHNNVPEGPSYPIRTVTNGEFRYIRNLTPDEIYIEKHLMGLQGDGLLNNPYWSTWVFKAGETQRAEMLVKRYMKRPAEQLYRTAEDRFELTDLAGNPEYGKIKAELSAELDKWMKAEGDPGIPLDTNEALNAARKGEHLY